MPAQRSIHSVARTARTLEIAANIGILASSCLLIAVLCLSYPKLSAPRKKVSGQMAKVGDRLTLDGFNWGAHRKNYVLALQVGCHFCTASAAELRTVLAAAGQHSDIGVVAVLPQEKEASHQYLAGLGIDVPFTQSRLSKLKVPGTPAVLMCNSQGAVQAVWFGQVDLRKQNEILKTMDPKGEETNAKGS